MRAEFVAFRLANYETPLWPSPNFADGRYNRAEAEDVAQYLSLHPMTPWAEVLRGDDRRSRERALLLRYPLWAVRIVLEREPLELTFDSVGQHGLSPESLVGDEMAPCQDLADRLRQSGVEGLIAPSAALPGTRNLIILAERVAIGFEHAPLDSIDVPTSLAAQDARCPEGLWDLVHYRGSATPHAGLDAWANGEDFIFDEPKYISR